MTRNRRVIFLLAAAIVVVLNVSLAGAQDREPAARASQGAVDLYLPLILQQEPPGPPVYPPINKIVFSAGYTVDAPYHDIYVMNPDGGGRTLVADGGNTAYLYPVWSPDGSQIAFTTSAGQSPNITNQIFIMNADGSGMYNLVNIGGHHFHAAWSPYGDVIAFSSDMHNPGPDTPNDIYAINADGSGAPVNLTNTPAVHEQNPDWSPDGTRIAYTAFSGPDFADVEIFIMNADGSGQTNVTQSATADYAPSWSPDSGRIAFYRNLGSGSSPNVQIFVMNADGSGQTQLTFNSGQNFYPDWSPSGAQIVYQTYFDAYADIYIMNADGSGATNITNSQYEYASSYPDWR